MLKGGWSFFWNEGLMFVNLLRLLSMWSQTAQSRGLFQMVQLQIILHQYVLGAQVARQLALKNGPFEPKYISSISSLDKSTTCKEIKSDASSSSWPHFDTYYILQIYQEHFKSGGNILVSLSTRLERFES